MKINPSWALWGAGISLLAGTAWAGVFPSYSLGDGNQDVRVFTGMHGTSVGRQGVFADIEGDGTIDAGFILLLEELNNPFMNSYIYSDVSFLRGPGGRWPARVNLVEERFTHLYERTATGVSALHGAADWNGDGRKDLVFYKSSLRVFWGRSSWSAYVDREHKGDVTLQWPNGLQPKSLVLSAGDLNGDGMEDFVLTDSSSPPAVNAVYVIPGRPTWPAFVDVHATTSVCRWTGYGGGLRGFRPVVDLNNDGYDDVVLNRSGGIEVMFGSASLPTAWDATTATAPLRLTSSLGWTLAFALTADLNGDDRFDLVVQEQAGAQVRWRAVDGVSVGSSTGTVPLDALSPYVLRQSGGGDSLETAGDFDGDGREDLVWMTTATAWSGTSVFLAADHPIDGPWTGTATFTIQGSPGERDECHLRDMDGDGKDDLWLIQIPSTADYQWHINLFYGFHPLRNPTVRAVDREAGSKRVNLELGVDGPVAEVKLGGDIEDEFKDQWVPFAEEKQVRLTASPGPKMVKAVYRIAAGRESAVASVGVDVEEEGPRVAVVTNRLRGAEGAVEVDCRVVGGRLKATVYERGGRKVRTAADEEATGVVTVRWDGRNEAGERVRPGVYVLVLDFDGQVDRRELLVEP